MPNNRLLFVSCDGYKPFIVSTLPEAISYLVIKYGVWEEDIRICPYNNGYTIFWHDCMYSEASCTFTAIYADVVS